MANNTAYSAARSGKPEDSYRATKYSESSSHNSAYSSIPAAFAGFMHFDGAIGLADHHSLGYDLVALKLLLGLQLFDHFTGGSGIGKAENQDVVN